MFCKLCNSSDITFFDNKTIQCNGCDNFLNEKEVGRYESNPDVQSVETPRQENVIRDTEWEPREFHFVKDPLL